jgi:hypothetical protein
VASCILLSFYLSMNAILVGFGWVAIGILAFAMNRKRYRELPEEVP